MKRQWENEELIEHWMLSAWDLAQLGNKTGATRLGFALLLKFFQRAGRGVRKMLARYAHAAGIMRSMSPHKWRHFLFTWLKKQGIDDALIQPYSGHESRQSLEIYSRLSLADAQPAYERMMHHFPIQ